MLTDSLPTNARSSLETSPSHLGRGIISPWIERHAGRGHVDRGDYNHARKQYYGAATDRLGPIVEMSPPDIVKRRTAAWPGMAVDIVHATRRGRIESHFCAPVHLLALYECDVRDDGGTYVEGLPKSTLRNISQKFIFVPAGHKFHDWQEPHILPRVTFFYFDPAGLALSPELGFANMSFAPRLFFEHRGLRDTALKLATLIESESLDHRLYAEALGVVLAHELVRFNAGKASVEPYVRGGLAAWQQRSVVAYIEDHLAERISLATLARLVRLSPYYFCRTFKQSFGMPAHRYHNSRRIERAKALLAEPSPSVTDIGFAVGFSQTSSFTSAFRKQTGMTPTAYHRSIG